VRNIVRGDDRLNRGFLIILIPAVLVTLGYLTVFHYAGLQPGYARLAAVMMVLAGGIWWLGRRDQKKDSSRRAD
jgi:uncharacterized membrane protein